MYKNKWVTHTMDSSSLGNINIDLYESQPLQNCRFRSSNLNTIAIYANWLFIPLAVKWRGRSCVATKQPKTLYSSQN